MGWNIALVLQRALFVKHLMAFEFMDRISEHCPMEWRILSGDEEAIYGFNGALGDQLNDGRHYTTIDIGGGSTELALGNKDGVYWSRSYPVGAVRLQSMSDEGPQRVWEETRFPLGSDDDSR